MAGKRETAARAIVVTRGVAAIVALMVMPGMDALGGAYNATSLSCHQDIPTELMHAERMIREGRVPDAVRGLRQWSDSSPPDERRAELAARLLLSLQAPSEALGFAREASDVRPDDPDVVGLEGTALLLSGRIRDAERFYARNARRFPEHADLQFQWGMASARNQKLLDADRAFAAAVEADGNQPIFRFWYGDNLLRLGRSAEAERQLAKALQAGPSSVADASWKLADAYAQQGKEREAEAQFLRGASLEGRARLRASFHFGLFLHERARHDEAVRAFRLVVRGWPEHRAAWYRLARAQHCLGDRDAARESHARYRALQREEDRLEDEHLIERIEALRRR